MAVQPIDWNAGGNVSLDSLYTGRRVRNEERRVDAYERMAEGQAGAMEDAQRRKSVTEQADWIARTGAAILSAPPDQRPNLYGMALEDARARGYDTSRLPPQYDQAVEGYIRFNVYRARAFTQPTRRGRGGPPAAGGAGGGPTLDPPYQPQGAIPPDAAGAPPAAPQPAPASVPPPGAPQPRPQIGAPARPGMAPAPPPGDLTSTGFGQAPPAPVGPAAGALPPQSQQPAPTPGNWGPEATGRMPPRVPAPAQPAPLAPVQDSGQDRMEGGGLPAPPAHPSGFDLRDKDQIVRGRNGAPRYDRQGRMEVRDANKQPAWRDPIKPATAPQGRAPAGFRFTPSGDLEPIPGGPKDPKAPQPAKQRPLTETARKNLKELADTAGALTESTVSFKDEYGGYGSTMRADAEFLFKRNIAGDTAAPDWWRMYQRQKNIERNELFGAALSAHEAAEFKKADIDPGMRPVTIRNNLNARASILLRGLSRVAASMQADGYNREAIEAVVGIPLDSLPAAVDDTPERRTAISKILGTRTGGAPAAGGPAPAGGQAPATPGGAPKRLKFNPATGGLE